MNYDQFQSHYNSNLLQNNVTFSPPMYTHNSKYKPQRETTHSLNIRYNLEFHVSKIKLNKTSI
jgi:hypothetical protein